MQYPCNETGLSGTIAYFWCWCGIKKSTCLPGQRHPLIHCTLWLCSDNLSLPVFSGLYPTFVQLKLHKGWNNSSRGGHICCHTTSRLWDQNWCHIGMCWCLFPPSWEHYHLVMDIPLNGLFSMYLLPICQSLSTWCRVPMMKTNSL